MQPVAHVTLASQAEWAHQQTFPNLRLNHPHTHASLGWGDSPERRHSLVTSSVILDRHNPIEQIWAGFLNSRSDSTRHPLKKDNTHHPLRDSILPWSPQKVALPWGAGRDPTGHQTGPLATPSWPEATSIVLTIVRLVHCIQKSSLPECSCFQTHCFNWLCSPLVLSKITFFLYCPQLQANRLLTLYPRNLLHAALSKTKHCNLM